MARRATGETSAPTRGSRRVMGRPPSARLLQMATQAPPTRSGSRAASSSNGFGRAPLRLRQKGTEVTRSQLDLETRGQISVSDVAEWESVLGSGAVRVVPPDQAQGIKRRWPDRILSSRMVRRLKPQEGLNARPRAKIRWCVHGHQDPGAEHLQCYAPPQGESVLLFLQVI